jgi:hypothetical protein
VVGCLNTVRSVQYGALLEQLRKCQLVKKDCAGWSYMCVCGWFLGWLIGYLGNLVNMLVCQ